MVQLEMLVSAIGSSKCPMVVCCLVMTQILFVSCNHVNPTNVNSSTPNINVSPSPQNQASLKAKVDALENQPLGPTHLGINHPLELQNVSEIIAAGDNAVPFLVEALKQEKKPVLVGYAVYCLRRIKTDKGKEPAVNLYKKLYKRRERLVGDEPFAFNQLIQYLVEISAIPPGMEPPGLRPQ